MNINDMFGYYGWIVYLVQKTEKTFSFILMYLSLYNRKITKYQFWQEYKQLNKLTMGQLIDYAKKNVKNIAPLLLMEMEKTVTKRNYIMHDFCFENAFAGFQKRLTEKKLNQYLIDFYYLNTVLDNNLFKLVVDQKEKNKVYKSSRTAPIFEVRKLKSKEKLISIYILENETHRDLFLPILVLEDLSRWTIGSKGLCPLPSWINKDDLIEIVEFIGKLPTTFNPKPKTNGDWNYFLDFQNKIRIRVEKLDDTNVEIAFQWRIIVDK